MKDNEIKKKVFTESAILAAILALLAGGVYYLDGISDDYDKQTTTLEGQLSASSAEMSALKRNIPR